MPPLHSRQLPQPPEARPAAKEANALASRYAYRASLCHFGSSPHDLCSKAVSSGLRCCFPAMRAPPEASYWYQVRPRPSILQLLAVFEATREAGWAAATNSDEPTRR